MKEEYIDSSKLDDDQLMMQYFKKYDTDHNQMLDGLELLNAILRMEGRISDFFWSLFDFPWHVEDDHHHEQDKEGEAAKEPATLEEVTGYVDEILGEDDKDKDGYINWAEFKMAQQTRSDKDNDKEETKSWDQ